MMNTANDSMFASAPPGRRWWTYSAFALLWAMFYLAAPLDFRFTVSDNFNAVNSDMSDEDRAEINAEETAQGSLARQVSLLTLALFGAACLALPAARRVRLQGVSGLAIVGFLLWTIASVGWSAEIGMTVRRLAVLICLAIAALGVAKQFSLRQIAWFAVIAGAVLLVGGICSELALGTFEPLDPEYRFSGLTWPAFDAWMLSLSLLGVAVLYPTAGRYRAAFVAFSIAALAAVLMAKTRASTAGLVGGFAIFAALVWPSRRLLLASMAGVACISAAILFLSLATSHAGDTLVEVINLGRAESAEGVSGRSQLWEDLLPFIANRPMTGYGYDSFWTPGHLVEIGEDNWGAPDAHNGYINLTLGVGLVGAAAYVLVLLSGICRACVESLRKRSTDYAFACAAIVVSAINAGFVSTQLAPALYAFVTMAILAKLGFIADPSEQEALLS